MSLVPRKMAHSIKYTGKSLTFTTIVDELYIQKGQGKIILILDSLSLVIKNFYILGHNVM